MVGSIDPRCETVRGTHWPKQGRWRVWNSRRGSHLGQRSNVTASTGRTYGCKRSDQTSKTLAARGPSTYGSRLGGRDDVERFRTSRYFGCSFRAAELMQYRRPVGPGPSSKTWPRWPLHFAHNTSVRIMPWLMSRSSSTLLSAAGSVKLGQPQPESNLASDSNRISPQPAQV